MELPLKPGARDNKAVTVELKEVLMPELQGADEITVGAWSKQQGEHVAEGETLMEAQTDKVNAEIPSPFSGKVDSIKVAMGIEYRREESNANPSPEVQQGLVFGNRLAFTEGHYDTKEAYFETGIPILRDLPFAKAVDVASHRAAADVQPFGQDLPGPVPARLQQREQRQQSR